MGVCSYSKLSAQSSCLAPSASVPPYFVCGGAAGGVAGAGGAESAGFAGGPSFAGAASVLFESAAFKSKLL